MGVNIEFLGLYDQNVIKPRTFLRDMFFKDHELHEVLKFEIEYRKGRQLVAPFVSEKIPGTEVVKRGYFSNIYQAPKVAPKQTFTAQELFFHKAAGENIYGGSSPEEKRAKKFGEAYADFEEQITRREESMCIDVLYKGKVTVKGEGVEDVIEYGAVKEVTPSALWTTAGADIAGDIEAAITDIGASTGLSVELIVMDPEAARLFVNNEKIQKMLDIRNYNVGTVSPSALPNGAVYLGKLAPYGVDIYSYQVLISKLSEDGKKYTSENLIPSGSVLIAASNHKLHYGPAADVELGVIVAERAPFEDKDTKANTIEIRTESRPLPVPYDIEAIRVLKVK